MKNMKRTIVLTAMALLISAAVAAQSTNQAGNQAGNEARINAQTQAQVHAEEGMAIQEQARSMDRMSRQERKQARAELRNEAALHGQTVSEVARTTESGRGKGEAVSQQARVKGETQQVRVRQETRALNGAAQRNQGVSASQMQRGNMNMTKRPGSGRK